MARGLVVEWGLPDGITEMQLGSVKGHLMELPDGLHFLFFERRRSDVLPFEEAVERFGVPKMTSCAGRL
jgi:hypothetical protein